MGGYASLESKIDIGQGRRDLARLGLLAASCDASACLETLRGLGLGWKIYSSAFLRLQGLRLS